MSKNPEKKGETKTDREGRVRNIRSMWQRAADGPTLIKNEAPIGLRTPNGFVWAHDHNDLMYIQRVPGVSCVTIWSRSMIKEFGENYHDSEFDYPEPPPRVLRPWPILRLPKGHKSPVQPPLGAIDEGCEFEHSDFKCYQMRWDDTDAVAAPRVPRLCPEDPAEPCSGRLLLNDARDPALDPTNALYDYFWCEHFKARIRTSDDPVQLLVQTSLQIESDRALLDGTGVKINPAITYTLRKDVMENLERWKNEKAKEEPPVSAVGDTEAKETAAGDDAPAIGETSASAGDAPAKADTPSPADNSPAKDAEPTTGGTADVTEAVAAVAEATTDGDVVMSESEAAALHPTDSEVPAPPAAEDTEHPHPDAPDLSGDTPMVDAVPSAESQGEPLAADATAVQDSNQEADVGPTVGPTVADGKADEPAADAPAGAGVPSPGLADDVSDDEAATDGEDSEDEGEDNEEDGEDSEEEGEEDAVDSEDDEEDASDVDGAATGEVKPAVKTEEAPTRTEDPTRPVLAHELFFTEGLPKLEEFIPDEYFPDVLMVHDPDRRTNAPLGDGADKYTPIKYKRVHPKFDRDELEDGRPERVAHLHLLRENKFGSGNHSYVYRCPLTLPPPLAGRSRTGQVTVAAKLAFRDCSAHELLHNEAHVYNSFPKHIMEDWCGYNIVPFCRYPVPVGAIAPKFFGYYLPVGRDGTVKERRHPNCSESRSCTVDWPSPILLMEECGEPVRPQKFTVDQRTECFSLILRLHEMDIIQGSFYVRNIMIQPGPLSAPPDKRSFDTPSFRIIDYGRGESWPPKNFDNDPQFDDDAKKRESKRFEFGRTLGDEVRRARRELMIEDFGY